MRERLRPYGKEDALNYLCMVATELLRWDNLQELPSLLAGFNSVLHTLDAPAQLALRNLRLANFAPATRRELRLMVDQYKAYHDGVRKLKDKESRPKGYVEQRFQVDDRLRIVKCWTTLVPDDVRDALSCLTGPLPLRGQPRPEAHNPADDAEVVVEGVDYRARIEAFGFEPPPPPLYDTGRVGKPPGFVPWDHLICMADEFDAADEAAGRQQPGERSWYRRLHDSKGAPTAVLLEPGDKGLVGAAGIDLRGVKHLIGLPGAGKTTLLYLLAGYLAKNGWRASFLFPSIEVATGFFEKLTQYGVRVGILSGQGETSRNRHVLNFAASLSAENQGYGVTRPAARFFATNCALAGFASDEEQQFPHDNPPCSGLLQAPEPGKRVRPHLCALSAVCGRQHSERELIEAPIWVGHVLSMDRSVSRLFANERLRHFEYIARTFDLLVVDECDGAQTSLDGQGTPLLKIVGDSQGVWSSLIFDLHAPAARGRNAFVSRVAVPGILEMTLRFGQAAERLTARIAHFDTSFRKQNANVLLTSLSIISDMHPYDDERTEEESERHRSAREAFERLWDAACKAVAFRLRADKGEADEEGEDDTDLERELSHAAELADVPVEDARNFYIRLLAALEAWDRDASETAMVEVARVLRNAPNLKSPHDDATFVDYTTLLTTVSLLVLQHFGLAPHLRLLNAEGLVSDGVFESRASSDQLAVLPESLVGRLSGVRYTVSDEGDVDIAEVGFSGTPRVLPHRMHQLGLERDGGMAVLLTSATSMLEPSPSFHVNVGPDYVLKRPNAGIGWSASRYRFAPLRDPLDSSKFLRFSGSKLSQRERVLRAMVDQLMVHGPLSELESALQNNDVDNNGVGRKAAFIVNSYEQCELVYSHIYANYPDWRSRVRYLVRASAAGTPSANGVTASTVEQLGFDPTWDLLIFPMNAIGRGVNIVYRFGPRADKAMLGTLFFLTRPHPRAESLQLIQGLVGRASETFDRSLFATTEDALRALKSARREVAGMLKGLLRLPLAAQALGRYAEPFVADQMIIILQTIGRAMRGDCPAFVNFVDAAWAPRSAIGQADSARTSMLVMMRRILQVCLTHPDPSKRQCYENLYQTFSVPMSNIENLTEEK
jgi:hypothetical protein